MRLAEILKESSPSLNLKITDSEINEKRNEMLFYVYFPQIDDGLDVVANFDYDGNVVDGGFGYEYGSQSGYHDQVELEDAGFDFSNVRLEHNLDNSEIKQVAQLLHMPVRQAMNPSNILKKLYSIWPLEDKMQEHAMERYDEWLADKLSGR